MTMTDAEVHQKLMAARDRLKLRPYRHRKTGQLYRVHTVALEESTLRPIVVYVAEDPEKPLIVWSRSLDEFLERFEPEPCQ